jgi:steroid delta-isomerase-like uncharacterized protein
VSSKENVDIVSRFIKAINSHDISSVEDIVAPDYVDHSRQLHGPEGARQFLSMIFRSFPDFHMQIEDLISEGDKVWFRITITGTHIGDFMGAPPTGNKFVEPAVMIFRMKDGKAIETWAVADEMDFNHKIGLIEYSERAKDILPSG